MEYEEYNGLKIPEDGLKDGIEIINKGYECGDTECSGSCDGISCFKCILDEDNKETLKQYIKERKEMEKQTFTKADLRIGMRVEQRDGDVMIVVDSDPENGFIANGEDCHGLNDFSSSLKSNHTLRYDIMKVFSAPAHLHSLDPNFGRKCIWERIENMVDKKVIECPGYCNCQWYIKHVDSVNILAATRRNN